MHPERFIALLPHAQALGMECVGFDPATGRCVMRIPWRDDLVGDPARNIVHGGVITTLLDTLGGAAVIALGHKAQGTLDLRVDYLRPATAPKDLIGEATCYRATRHVAFVRGACHQGDPTRPVAELTATFVLADPKGTVEELRP